VGAGQLLALSVAVISGFLGGALSVWFLMPQLVLAQDGLPKVIEAQEFRVVDEEGKTYVRVAQEGLIIFEQGLDQGLFIYDQDGDERVSLDREQLSIRNPDGAAVLSSSSPSTKEPTLALLGKGGR